jgi:hypothetical protein
MNAVKPNAVDSLALAVACHRRFLSYLADECLRENRSLAEATPPTPSNAAKRALHTSALETFQSAAKEFGTPPTSDTPNYTVFLQEIMRLLALRCWGRLGDLSHSANSLVSLTLGSERLLDYTATLGVETGRAQATLRMHDWLSLQLVLYLECLEGK